MKLSTLVNPVKTYFSQNAPGLLTGFGVSGMFVAVIFTVKATSKAVKSIEKKKEELGKEKLTFGETVEATWKYYIPTAVTLATSAACVIGANSVNTRRNAAIAAAYSISESAFTEYKDKVKETIGERKERDIESDIARDRVNANPPAQNTIVVTGKGETLFLEAITNQPFKSDIEKLRRIENDLNREMRSSMTMSLNDVYSAIGLPVNHKLYDDLGWDIDKHPIEFIFTPVLDQNNEVCIVLDYRYTPEPIV